MFTIFPFISASGKCERETIQLRSHRVLVRVGNVIPVPDRLIEKETRHQRRLMERMARLLMSGQLLEPQEVRVETTAQER
jgi:hypothetical protein